MIRFRETPIDDGQRRFDVWREFPAEFPEEEGRDRHPPYQLGSIWYHYGFDQWVFDPKAVLLPLDQIKVITESMKGLSAPTQKERDAYNAYDGDPLAR